MHKVKLNVPRDFILPAAAGRRLKVWLWFRRDCVGEEV
jgi:hypothetical protein